MYDTHIWAIHASEYLLFAFYSSTLSTTRTCCAVQHNVVVQEAAVLAPTVLTHRSRAHAACPAAVRASPASAQTRTIISEQDCDAIKSLTSLPFVPQLIMQMACMNCIHVMLMLIYMSPIDDTSLPICEVGCRFGTEP